MKRIIFTGPESVSTKKYDYIRETVASLWILEPEEFVSGCANGVDTIAALAAAESFPLARHRLVVPQGRHNPGLVKRWEKWARERGDNYVIQRITDTPMSKNPHIYRNEVMVNLGRSKTDVLCAFPQTAEEHQRSGTWTTVRRARVAKLNILFYPLKTGQEWTELT